MEIHLNGVYNMKKVILMMSVVCLSFGVMAQQQKPKKEHQHEQGKGKSYEERAEHEMAKLKQELQLTDEQTAKLAPITQAKFEKIKALRATKTESNKKDVHSQVKAEMDAWVNQVKPELTPEQNVKFDAWLAKKKEEMKKEEGHK